MTVGPNVLGLAIKQLLRKGVKYDQEIRPRRKVYGIAMRQHLQPFVLIEGMGRRGGSVETDLAFVHRFLVETSFTHEQPIVLAYKPYIGEVRFYAVDPRQIKKVSNVIRIEDYVGMPFPVKLGWRWQPSEDLAMLWKRMRASRYNEVTLDKFLN